jgi:oligopeptidase B
VKLDRTPEPPEAKKIDHVETRQGKQVVDPYRWMRDDERKNPEVIAYLEAENAYTEAVMKPTEALRKRLYDEMVARIKETDMSVPVRDGDYFYYTRTEEGKQYGIHCRKKGNLKADEEILLDENRLADGREYLRVGVFEVSPDHSLLAYSTNFDGSEKYTLRFKDLRTGELLADEIEGTYYAVEWGNDNRTVFYDTIDAAHRPYRLYRHILGSDPASADLIYEEKDDAYFLGLYKTKDRRYLVMYLESAVTSEQRFLDADEPAGEFRIVHPRQHQMEYSIEHWNGKLYILTNDEAINFRLVEAPVSDPSKNNWRAVIPHDQRIKLDGIDVFAGHMAVSQRKNGLRGLRIIDLPGWSEHEIEFAEPVYTVHPTDNVEFAGEVMRFRYESLITADSVFDYNMRTRERELKKQKEVLGGYDPGRYVSERVFAEAQDGKEIPISLVYRKGTRRDGGNPTLLYGYGSYGHTVDPGFSSNRLSLLDRGFVFAIANIRGGGALGRPWYESGKLLHKRNTFTDFITVAEHLIAERYTSSDRLAILGGSAGGLLIGAAINMRPDLFHAAVAKVPFVDVMNTMLDPTIPLTVIEWEEWGNPQQADYYEYMLSYSPYDNVAARDYPHLLVTSGLNDPRVGYWEPTKWTARLRATKTDDNVLLLKTNMGTGHSGASGRYDSLKELAFEYAFLITQLGADAG